MLITKKVTLFEHVQIRDIISHYPGEMLDLTKAKSWSFEVNNNLNQSVGCYLIGGNSRGDVNSNVTISAKTVEPIVTNIWLSQLGIKLICSTAPTSGDITVIGEIQEDK